MEITFEGIVAIVALVISVVLILFTDVVKENSVIFLVGIIFLFVLLLTFTYLNNKINKVEIALKKRKGQIDPRLVILLLILLFLYLYLKSTGRI